MRPISIIQIDAANAKRAPYFGPDVGAWRQALATLEAPRRETGWVHTDAAVLDGQGRVSTYLGPHMAIVLGDVPVHQIPCPALGGGVKGVLRGRRIDRWSASGAGGRRRVGAEILGRGLSGGVSALVDEPIAAG